MIATHAYLLRSTAYGESDLVVTLLTRRLGRVALLAKGARRSRRRFGGILDYFRLLDVQVRPGRSGMGRLLGADLVRSHDLATSMETYWAGTYALEVARLGTREGDPDEAMFHLLGACLRALGEGREVRSVVRVFQARTLAALGYGLPTAACPECGADFERSPAVRRGDAVLCRECGEGERISAGALRTLAAAIDLPVGRIGSLRVPAALDRELRPLLEGALVEALGVRPRSTGEVPEGSDVDPFRATLVT